MAAVRMIAYQQRIMRAYNKKIRHCLMTKKRFSTLSYGGSEQISKRREVSLNLERPIPCYKNVSGGSMLASVS